jgi:hypothetical protein
MPSFSLVENQTAREDLPPRLQGTKGKLTGRTGRSGRKDPFCGRHLRDADTAEGREKGHFTTEITEGAEEEEAN